MYYVLCTYVICGDIKTIKYNEMKHILTNGYSKGNVLTKNINRMLFGNQREFESIAYFMVCALLL